MRKQTTKEAVINKIERELERQKLLKEMQAKIDLILQLLQEQSNAKVSKPKSKK